MDLALSSGDDSTIPEDSASDEVLVGISNACCKCASSGFQSYYCVLMVFIYLGSTRIYWHPLLFLIMAFVYSLFQKLL